MVLDPVPHLLCPALVLCAVTNFAPQAQIPVTDAQGAGRPASHLDVLWPDAIDRPVPDPAAVGHIVVDDKLHDVLDDLLRRSPSFRRQWRVLATSQHLEVRIRLVFKSPVAASHAATTFGTLPNGALLAETALAAGRRVPELLGHEVEHILEHLDGARVHAQHALGDASIRRRAGTFETARAALVGRQVSAEFYAR